MSEGLLVRQCAPTLAGIKTGNIFSTDYEDKPALYRQIRQLNQRLGTKGLCLLPLRCRNGRALLYLYRPAKLRHDLKNAQAHDMLTRAGYRAENPGQCVARLTRRLRERAEFPHEIGLFLSYPPEDVRGFMENNARDFKFSGLWKVYGDEAYARAAFASYKHCTSLYTRRWQEGSTLDELAVAPGAQAS